VNVHVLTVRCRKIECPGSSNVEIPFGSKHLKCFVNE
jgi:hypothetical protein